MSYTFRLSQFEVVKPRSGGPGVEVAGLRFGGGTDTDTVSFLLTVGGRSFGALLRSMGDVGRGWHPVGLEFPNIEIPDAEDLVFLNFEIDNAGHANPANFNAALANAASALAGVGPPYQMFLTPDLPLQVGILNAEGVAAFDFLAGLLGGGVNCDGTVARQQIVGTRGAFDAKFPPGVRSVTQTITQPGDPSPGGCGENSLYRVTLTYIRTDGQPVRGPDPDSTFLIMNRGSGLVLDIPDASNAPGVRVQQYPENGGDNQKWRLEPVDDNRNWWRIRSVSSGLVLDVENASHDNNAHVNQFPDHGGPNQQWEFLPVGDGGGVIEGFLQQPLGPRNTFFEIASRESGKVLDVPASTSAPQTPIQQYDANNGYNQAWQLIRV